MRIGIVGKGGAGKTTVAALLSQHAASRGLQVLAIDADINQHLALAFGLDESSSHNLCPLGAQFERLKEYVRGQNPRISSHTEMIKTTPPGSGSRFITLSPSDQFLTCATRVSDNIRLLVSGELDAEDIGTRCYHGKVGAVELLLNHLIDTERDLVVVDMTAGADAFASGIFTRFDVLLLVCEPTKRSLVVFEQFLKYSRRFGVNLKVMANKTKSLEGIEYVKYVAGDAYVGHLSQSIHLESFEDRGVTQLDGMERGNTQVLDTLITAASKQRDWRKYYEQAIFFHIENANSWANALVGCDLSKQIDPSILSIRSEKDLPLVC